MQAKIDFYLKNRILQTVKSSVCKIKNEHISQGFRGLSFLHRQ